MATMAECPECGAKLKKENLRRHTTKIHQGGPKVEPKAPRLRAPRPPVTAFPWRLMAVLAIAGGVTGTAVLGGFLPTFTSDGNPPPPPPGSTRIAVMDVVWGSSSGTIRIELDLALAPVTAGNFINLVNGRFYDGLTFHRVVPNFVIQGGDPNGDGSGGSPDEIAWEDTGLKNRKYTIAMARSSPNDASSQFFINLADNANLDAPEQQYPYVVFGKVIQGQDVVDAIGRVPTNGERPVETVTMTQVRMLG